MIGDESNKVENLTVGHELEESLLEYCKNNNIDTVVTYHPPPYKRIIDENEVETYLPDPITESFVDSSINVISSGVLTLGNMIALTFSLFEAIASKSRSPCLVL